MIKSKETIGVLDSALIMSRSLSEVNISSSDIVKYLKERFNIHYFPKLEVLYSLNSVFLPIVEENVKLMEKLGISVSQGFKDVMNNISKGGINLRRNRRTLMDNYAREASQLGLIIDLTFSPSMRIFPLSAGEIFELAERCKVASIGITLRGFSDINIRNNLDMIKLILANQGRYVFHRRVLVHLLWVLIEPYHNLYVIWKIRKCEKLKFIGLINKSQLLQFPALNKMRDKVRILVPGEAVRLSRKRIEKFDEKESYLVFYYRVLYAEKGLFDIPKVAKMLKSLGYANKILVVGGFSTPEDELSFRRSVERNGVDDIIKVMGFLPDNELLQTIRKARAYVYPSHSDAYSRTVLESIFLGTQVVAYSIPSFAELYSSIAPVSLVKENCILCMASKIIEILNEDPQTYSSKFERPDVINFIKMHDSYKKVADSLVELIKNDCDVNPT